MSSTPGDVKRLERSCLSRVHSSLSAKAHQLGGTVDVLCEVADSHEGARVDRFQGEPAEDTGITSVFLGPRVVASFGRVSSEVGLDIPVSIDNTSLQTVPDYRVRAGVAFRF